MTRPEIVRADSIDLQDRDAPSAQNHTARPSPLKTKQSANATGPATVAPHQAETLREVAAETAEEEARSPRVSWTNSAANGPAAADLQQYAEDLAAGVTSSLGILSHDGDQNGSAHYNMAAGAQDDLAVAQNGGMVAQDNTDDADADADADVDGEEEDLDDDMMDKISSSPSIDDGGSTCQLPSFDAILQPDASPGSPPASACFSEARSSSPYLDHPDYLPLQRASQKCPDRVLVETPSRHHHLLPGGFPKDHDDHAIDDDTTARDAEEEADPVGGPHARRRNEILLGGDDTDLRSPADETVDADNCGGEYDETELLANINAADFDVEKEFSGNDDLTVPYEDTTDEDDDDDLFLQCQDSRLVDSGWGGECLQDTEDIDFELVYALHTFIATVEGQANATKGDAMVLLDDSNSYWWLVRVVKDSSIGYLPAEHIETPTERLARLNKHRNIDLSATMLGDQAEKAKNPIKTAMRRRKTKNVSFAAPTYVDYSDYDYSSEDEEEGEGDAAVQQQQQQQQAQQQQQQQQQASTTKQVNGDDVDNAEESAKVAPLRPRGQQKTVQIADPVNSTDDASPKTTGRTSEEIFETNGVEGPKKKADGTVRDSFFKDDTVETKKITLTPNLLRDDGTVRESSDSIERGINKRPSFDRLEKEAKEDKKKNKEKKEKEKKGGFRSLFSRGKDKKQKGDEDEDPIIGKRSADLGSEAVERPSDDVDPGAEKANMSPSRTPSKLHKQQPRVEPSLARKAGVPADTGSGMDLSTFLNENSLKPVSSVPPASMRIVDPDADLFEDDDDEDEDEEPEKTQPSKAAARSASVDESKASAPKQAPVRSQSVDDNKPVKPVKTTAAKSRMQIEDSDSDDEVQEIVRAPAPKDPVSEQPQAEQQPRQQEQQKVQRPTLPGSFPDSYISAASAESTSTVTPDKPAVSTPQAERLSESPIEVSPITPSESQPPALTGDNSSQEDHSSPVSSPSPELIDREEAAGTHRKQDSVTTSTSTTTVSAWNDTSLREFFDSGTDIRDLLVVVYDKNDVEPVGPDHPVAGTLFKEQNAKLAEITTQLDNMLGDWLARKQRLRGTV